MKTHTSGFKTNIKSLGRQLSTRITYGNTTLTNEDINSINYNYKGDILKSVMKQLEIDSNIDIPLKTQITLQFGVLVGNSYEYLNYGTFIVEKSEKQENTNSYKITCYDKMILSMVDYEDLGITYPITIRSYINAICTKLGITFANASSTFVNYNKEIPNELYLDDNGNSLGFTFRDVLDQLAQVTASTICINDSGNLEVRYITNTNDTIDEEFLKNINVNFGEQYGAINTIVLSRSAGADKISLSQPTTLPDADKIAIEISDNQILNGNDRDTYLSEILTKLYGLTYYINDFDSTGICYYDLCDRYNVTIDNTTYSCVMLNDEINITQGLSENIYTELPKTSEQEYKYMDSTDRRINQTTLIVNKQQGEITALVSQVENIEEDIQNPTSTKQGTSIDITDALDSPLIDFKMYGDTQQATAILPSTYQQVEYIESSGTQYIDTGVNADTNISIRIDAKFNDNSSYTYQNAMGAINIQNGNKRFHINPNDINTIAFQYASGYTAKIVTTGYTKRFNAFIDVYNRTWESTVEGTTTTGTLTITTDYDTTENFWLFRRNGENAGLRYYAQVRIYSCKLYDSGVLVRDYIPCYRKSDNVIGLYDLVNNVFYTNEGTGTFTKGNDVTLPTPDYPQPIQVVTGRNDINVCGKNFLNCNNISGTVANVDYTLQDGVLTLNGTANSTTALTGLGIFIQTKDIDYSWTYVYDSGTCSDYGGGLFLADTPTSTTNTGGGAGFRSSQSRTVKQFTNKEQHTYYLYLTVNSGTVFTNYKVKPLIVKGTEYDYDFEPYTGYTQEINLGSIELNKISTYQDYIYKDNDRWFLHKEIGKVVFDNDSTFTSNPNGTNSYDYAMGGYIRKSNEKNVLCEVFRGVAFDNRVTSGDNICYLDTNLTFYRLTFRNTTYTSVNDFKNMMIGKIAYYALLTPQEIEITDTTLLEQLNNLMTLPLYKNLTHITLTPNDLQPTMKIEYFRDTSINENFVSKEDMTKYYTKKETDAQILINSSSIQQSVSEVQETTNSNTGAITTLSNQVNTLQSSTNLRIDAINEQLEDGVSKVKTTTGYTFDSNGLSITKGQGFSSLTTDRYQKIEYNNKELSFMGFDDTLNKPISRIEELEARKITTGVHRTEKIQESGEYWTAQYYVGGGN